MYTFGRPKFLYFDPSGEARSQWLRRRASLFGFGIDICAPQSHWHIGTVEVRQKLLKKQLTLSAKGIDAHVSENCLLTVSLPRTR